MAEVLSQSELASLLARLETVTGHTPGAYHGRIPPHVEWNAEQHRHLEQLHGKLAEVLAEALQDRLGADMLLDVGGIQQAAVPPTQAESLTWLSLSWPSTDRSARIGFNRVCVFSFIERALGTGTQGTLLLDRAPTLVEQKLLMRVADGICQSVPRCFSAEQAGYSEPVTGDAAHIRFQFSTNVGAAGCELFLEIPEDQCWTAVVTRDSAEGCKSESCVELVAVLAETRLPDSEVRDLQVGDVIVTEESCTSPVQLFSQGGLAFRGQAGVDAGRLAIRISERGPEFDAVCGEPAGP